MSTRMNEQKIAEIVAMAQKEGFFSQMKDDGERRYAKNLKLVSGRLPYPVYLHLETGVASVSALPRYLKVAVHPDCWSEAVLAPESGVEALLNTKTKTSFFSSSNWDAFPCRAGSKGPVGRCYRVDTSAGTLDAFGRLLRGLAATSLPGRPDFAA